MAKSTNDLKKITFGVRRKGKVSKRKGPKDKPVSKYRRQG
jgi:hypothetical protein